jgi:hypothetical protein
MGFRLGIKVAQTVLEQRQDLVPPLLSGLGKPYGSEYCVVYLIAALITVTSFNYSN